MILHIKTGAVILNLDTTFNRDIDFLNNTLGKYFEKYLNTNTNAF